MRVTVNVVGWTNTRLNWQDSQDLTYAFLRTEHRPFLDPQLTGDTNIEVMGAGNTSNSQPVANTKALAFTWRDQLTNIARLYRWGYLKSVRYKIEWLGTITEAEGHVNLDVAWNESNPANVQGQYVGNFANMSWDKPFVNILFGRVHEEFDYHRNTNGTAQLEPFLNLGLGQPTRLVYPDVMNTNPFVAGGQKGFMEWRYLQNTRSLKKLRFTPAKNIQWVRWLPRTRADKMFVKYDLQKMLQQTSTPTLAAYDMDMRVGGLWFGQERPLVGGQMPGNIVNTAIGTADLFRITVFADWQMYGRMHNFSTPIVV